MDLESAMGHSCVCVCVGGGILMGAKEEVLELEDYEIGEFYASMVLRHGL
jgi:hypothetical protein